MKTITKEKLFEMKDDITFREEFEYEKDLDKPISIISLITGDSKTGFHSTTEFLWLAGEILPREKIVIFACDCALINVELIKPYVTEEYYKYIINFLNNPTKEKALKTAEELSYAYNLCCTKSYNYKVCRAIDYVICATRSIFADNNDLAGYEAAHACPEDLEKSQVDKLLIKLFS